MRSSIKTKKKIAFEIILPINLDLFLSTVENAPSIQLLFHQLVILAIQVYLGRMMLS